MASRPAFRRSFFEKQVVGCLDQLYAAALRLEKNREDAEDLVMEAITKAWGNRQSLKQRANFRAWLLRILTNAFLSHCRKRSLRPVTEPWSDEAERQFSLFEQLHQPFLLWWSNPEREFVNKLLRRDIEQAVDSLPEAFRVVVVLSEMQGLSYQEIANILKVPIGTVRSRLSRGRSLLQKALWEHGQEAGLTAPRGVSRKRS
jgi:RNA polymerase sigma-70 factor (ECF subfamily)